MNGRERIEEAHGLWELAIVRLAVLAEARASSKLIAEAVKKERKAFEHWQAVSDEVTKGEL